MNMLKTYQNEFMYSLYTKGDFSKFIANPSQFENFDIYINNCFLGLAANLQDKFPICRMILGDDFFDKVAHNYIAEFPQKSGENNSFGDNFSNFLFQTAQEFEIEYVCDIAKIEWARFLAEITKFEPAIDFEIIANLFENGDFNKIKLRENVQIIGANSNAFEIYTAHLHNKLEDLQIQNCRQNILIWVDDEFNPQFKIISEFQYDLIENTRTQNIAIALESALAKLIDQAQAQNEFIELGNLGVFTTN
jgi:hypothetical protein